VRFDNNHIIKKNEPYFRNMDSKNLSYNYLVNFIDKYSESEKDDFGRFYVCRGCIKIKMAYDDLDDGSKFDYHKFDNGETMCIECYNDGKDSLGGEYYDEENVGCLTFDEVEKIMSDFEDSECSANRSICKICKKIRLLYEDDDVTIDGVKYDNYCVLCDVLYPTCCLDYYKLPKSSYDKNTDYKAIHPNGEMYELCIACINKKEMVEIKPAKK